MELLITGQNLEVGDETRDYVGRKLAKLERHLPQITVCTVELSREQVKSPERRYVAEVTLEVKGTLLRGEERAEELRKAIDKVTDVLARQVERYRGKRNDKGRGKSLARDQSLEPESGAPAAGTVVRVKRFQVEPMTVEGAIEQMELLGHSFFLFLNDETDGLNLLYRRRDGDYSIIEPEMAEAD